MASRRSIYPKDCTGHPVPDEVIHQMLTNAHLAPNHKITEPWRFVAFTGAGRQALAHFQSECYKTVAQREGTFHEDRYLSLQKKPFESSHIIALGMKRDENRMVPEWEELGAVFCAIENMYLTANAYGVGCYLSTGGITQMIEAKPLFGLGEADKLCGFLSVGMPKANLPPGCLRKPVVDKVKWIVE